MTNRNDDKKIAPLDADTMARITAPVDAPAPLDADTMARITRPETTVGQRVFSDSAVSLGKGVVGLGEAAVGLADLASGGHAGKLVKDAGLDLAKVQQDLEAKYTPEQQAANKAVRDADGFFGTVGAALTNPSTIVQAALESLPASVVGGFLGRGLAAGASRLGATIGPTGEALAAGAGEGIIGAGNAAESIRQESADGLLTAGQTAAALGSGAGTAAFGALGGKMAHQLGVGDPDVAFMRGLRKDAELRAPKGLLRRTAEGALSEGVFEELPQSMQEQAWQNLAQDKPLTQGVLEAGAQGMLAGGLMGGGFSALSPGHKSGGDNPPPPPGGGGPRGDTPPPPPPGGGSSTAGGNPPPPPGGGSSAGGDTPPPPPGGGSSAGGDTPPPPGGGGPRTAAPKPLSPLEQARLAELDAITSGTPATKAVDPLSGQPVIVPGTPPRFFTAEEKAEYDNLDARRDIPNGPLARAAAPVMDNNKLFPFATADMAQKQADILSNRTGRAHEVAEHPTVKGKWAAVEKEAADGTGTAADGGVGTNVPGGQPGNAGAHAGAGLGDAAGAGTMGARPAAPGADAGVRAEAAAGAAGGVGQNAGPVTPTAAPTTYPTQFAAQQALSVMPGRGGKSVAKTAAGWEIVNQSDAVDVTARSPAPTNAGAAKVTPESIAPKNDVDLAAHEAAASPLNPRREPTDGQKDADNYKLGRPKPADIHGLQIGIENPKGSIRQSKKDAPVQWQTLMTAHYGRFTGTVGADGDAVDTFIGDKPEAPKAFVIDQVDPKTGKFDEHKVVLGVDSIEEARQLYQDNYQPGWQGLKNITETTPAALKKWLFNGDTTREFAGQNVPKVTPAISAEDLPDAGAADDRAGFLPTGEKGVLEKREADGSLRYLRTGPDGAVQNDYTQWTYRTTGANGRPAEYVLTRDNASGELRMRSDGLQDIDVAGAPTIEDAIRDHAGGNAPIELVEAPSLAAATAKRQSEAAAKNGANVSTPSTNGADMSKNTGKIDTSAPAKGKDTQNPPAESKSAASADAGLDKARSALKKHLGEQGGLFQLVGVQHTAARAEVMSALKGKKVPQKEAGINALKDELYRRIGIGEGTIAEQDAQFQRWFKEGGEVKGPSENSRTSESVQKTSESSEKATVGKKQEQAPKSDEKAKTSGAESSEEADSDEEEDKPFTAPRPITREDFVAELSEKGEIDVGNARFNVKEATNEYKSRNFKPGYYVYHDYPGAFGLHGHNDGLTREQAVELAAAYYFNWGHLPYDRNHGMYEYALYKIERTGKPAILESQAKKILGSLTPKIMKRLREEGAIVKDEADLTRRKPLFDKVFGTKAADDASRHKADTGDGKQTVAPVASDAAENVVDGFDPSKLVFKGADSGHPVPPELAARVQAALRDHPESYRVSEVSGGNFALGLPNKGRFFVRGDGSTTLMGDDAFGWASTMTKTSVIRTLKGWLKEVEGKKTAGDTQKPSKAAEDTQKPSADSPAAKLAGQLREYYEFGYLGARNPDDFAEKFRTENGPVDAATLRAAMDQLVAEGVLETVEQFSKKRGAKVTMYRPVRRDEPVEKAPKLTYKAEFGQRAQAILDQLPPTLELDKDGRYPEVSDATRVQVRQLVGQLSKELSDLHGEMVAANAYAADMAHLAWDNIDSVEYAAFGEDWGGISEEVAKNVRHYLQAIILGNPPDGSKPNLKTVGPEHVHNEGKPYTAEPYEPAAGDAPVTYEGDIDTTIEIPVPVDEFKEATDEWARLFAAPEERTVLDRKAREQGYRTLSEAEKQIEEWRAHARAQAEIPRAKNGNSRRVVISLFDYTGEWSKPWEEAGYEVKRFDIQHGEDVMNFSSAYFTDRHNLSNVYLILAAPPCTDFTLAATRLWAEKDANGSTETSKELVLQTLRTIEYFRPTLWALENPAGRIAKVAGLPDPTLTFEPHHFGIPYTKKTMIYGRFHPELPVANVFPALGSITDQVGGGSQGTKNARAETPEGFAYAFFMANNYLDLPAEVRLPEQFPEASGAIRAALKHGMTEDEVLELMDNTDLLDGGRRARNALLKAVAKRFGVEVAEEAEEARNIVTGYAERDDAAEDEDGSAGMDDDDLAPGEDEDDYEGSLIGKEYDSRQQAQAAIDHAKEIGDPTFYEVDEVHEGWSGRVYFRAVEIEEEDAQKLSEYDRKVMAGAERWGYPEGTLLRTKDGAVTSVFPDSEIALEYSNSKSSGSAKYLHFNVRVAQGPNGKWAFSTSYHQGTNGASGLPNVLGDMYDTREEAIAAGVERLRTNLAPAAHAALDREAAKLGMAGLQKMKQAKAAKEAKEAAPAEQSAGLPKGVIGSGEKLKTASGRIVTAPKFDGEPQRVAGWDKEVSTALDKWLIKQARAEAEADANSIYAPGKPWSKFIYEEINRSQNLHKKIGYSDRQALLSALFGDGLGPTDKNRVSPDAKPGLDKMQKAKAAAEKAAQPVATNVAADERLLLVACSDSKKPGRHPAAQLYTGALFEMLNKWMPANAAPQLFILSAKHGLVRGDAEIDSYDEKMTAERKKELLAQKLDLSQFNRDKPLREVFIAGPAEYKMVAAAYVKQLKAAGIIAPDAVVQTTTGGIGDMRGQLGDYLRSIEAATPAASTAAAVHVENGQAEPATAIVIAQAIKKSANNTRLDLRGAQQRLLEEIDGAIKALKDGEPDTSQMGYKEAARVQKEWAKKHPASVTFDVSGDGKFKVVNTVEKLTEFRKKIAANTGFNPNTGKKGFSGRTFAIGESNSTTLLEMLDQGEKVAAHEFAKAIGKPFRFTPSSRAGEPGDDGVPNLYIDAREVDGMPHGIKGFVGRRYTPKHDGGWLFIEATTGQHIGNGKYTSAQAAIDGARARLKEVGADKIAAGMEKAPKSDEAALEAKWLEAAEKSDAAIAEQNAKVSEQAVAQKQAEAYDYALWSTVAGKTPGMEAMLDKLPRMLDLPTLNKLLATAEDDGADTLDRFAEMLKRRVAATSPVHNAAFEKRVDEALAKAKRIKGGNLTPREQIEAAGLIVKPNQAKPDRIEVQMAGSDKVGVIHINDVDADSFWAEIGSGRSRPIMKLAEAIDWLKNWYADEAKQKPAAKQDRKSSLTRENVAQLVKNAAGRTYSDSAYRRQVSTVEKGLVEMGLTRSQAEQLVADVKTEVARAQRGRMDFLQVRDVVALMERRGYLPKPESDGNNDGRITQNIAAKNALTNPVMHGDLFKLADGTVWEARQGYSGMGWSLVRDKKTHPLATNVDGQVAFIRAITAATQAQPAAQENVAPTQAWHVAFPETGLPIEDSDTKGTGYRAVVGRVAREAIEAITQTQRLGGTPLYAYVLPAQNGTHGRVRMVPEDQEAPAGWTLIEPGAWRVGALSNEQMIARLTGLLASQPIIGSRDEAVSPKKKAETDIDPFQFQNMPRLLAALRAVKAQLDAGGEVTGVTLEPAAGTSYLRYTFDGQVVGLQRIDDDGKKFSKEVLAREVKNKLQEAEAYVAERPERLKDAPVEPVKTPAAKKDEPAQVRGPDGKLTTDVRGVFQKHIDDGMTEITEIGTPEAPAIRLSMPGDPYIKFEINDPAMVQFVREAVAKKLGLASAEPLEPQVERAVDKVLSAEDKTEVAKHFGEASFNDAARGKLVAAAINYINQKIDDTVTKLREILRKVAATLMSMVMIVNPNVISTPESFVVIPKAAPTAVTAPAAAAPAPTTTVTHTVLADVPAEAAQLSEAGRQAYRTLIPALSGRIGDKLIVMADKPSGRVFVFEGNGKLVMQKKALFGLAKGDYYVGNNNLKQNRITPAGLFGLKVVDAKASASAKKTAGEYDFGKVFALEDPDAVVTIMHSVWLKEKDAKRRAAALKNDDGADSRYSFGCINLDKSMARELFSKYESRMDGAKLFVVPDDPHAVQEFLNGDIAHNTGAKQDRLVREAAEPVTVTLTQPAGDAPKLSRRNDRFARQLDPAAKARIFNRNLDNLLPQEQAALDAFVASRADGAQVLSRLREHIGTPWAKQSIEGIFIRQAILSYANGQTPAFASLMEEPSVHNLRRSLDLNGMEAVMRHLEANSYIGDAAKPLNNVPGSFINCDPSPACAKYCYATGNKYPTVNPMIKAELVTLAVEHDPLRAARRTADNYKMLPEFAANKALRLFDKGDGDASWLPYIEELNRLGVRTQIFSKNPAFLREVPAMNVRLLSIDQSNLALADANRDLPVAFVYDASHGQLEFLSKLVKRGQLGVVLPIKQGQRLLNKGEIATLKDGVDGIGPYICPVDAGIKPIGDRYSGHDKWNCTKCDKDGAVGCFFGQPNKLALAQAFPQSAEKQAELALQLKERIDAAIRQEHANAAGTGGAVAADGRVPAAGIQDLLRQFDAVVGELFARYDADREGADALGSAAGTEAADRTDQGAAGRTGRGRRVIPIRPADAGDEPLKSRGQGRTGYHVSALRGALQSVAANWKNAPAGGIFAVQSASELPSSLLNRIGADDLQTVRGVFDPATEAVYLIADRLDGDAQAQFVLAHEVLGHYGLSRVMGRDALARELGRLRLANPALAAAARAQMDKHGIDLVEATEEAMADWAGEGRTLTGWKAFVAAVQRALRAIGLDRVADWLEGRTQAETLALLAQARRAVTGNNSVGVFDEAQALQFSGNPVFVSELTRALEKSPMKAAPAAQWINVLSGLQSKGVKPEEIEWSGVREWLSMQDGKVSRDDVLAFLSENGTRVSERILGERDADYEQRRTAYINERVERARAEYETYTQAQIESRMEHWESSVYVRDVEDDDGNIRWEVRVDGQTLEVHDSEEKAQEVADEYNSQDERDAYERVRDDYAPFDEEGVAEDAGNDFDNDNDGEGPRYANYRTVPGGAADTYRELLITLPKMPGGQELRRKAVFDRYQPQIDALHKEIQAIVTAANPDLDARAELLEKQRQLMRQRDLEARAAAGEVETYGTNHWPDDRNVVAHLRFDTRTDADGRKLMVLHEIQSDWGEQGRKQGFRDDAARELLALNREIDAMGGAEAMHKRMDELVAEFEARTGKKAFDERGRGTDDFVNVPESDEWNRLAGLDERKMELQTGNEVPTGPFVKNTAAWVSLAIKRIIAYAAANGYDRVVLPNGDQANAAFSLAKRVTIRYAHKGDGRIWLHVKEASTERDVTERTVRPEELPALVGKEIADRILRREGRAAPSDALESIQKRGEATRVYQKPNGSWYLGFADGSELGTYVSEESARREAASIAAMVKDEQPRLLAGDDLEIGGEPMRKFYDGIVANTANDVLRRLGGPRLQQVDLGLRQRRIIGEQETPEGRPLRVIESRSGMGRYTIELEGSDVTWGAWNDRAVAEKALREFQMRYREKTVRQMGFDITPELRSRALAGVPLFARAWHGTPHSFDRFSAEQVGTGEGAQAFGWGLYFAGRKPVAEHYRKGLTLRDFVNKAKEAYDEHDSPDDAVDALKEIEGLSGAQKELLDALQADDWLGFDYPHQAIMAAYREPGNFDLSERVKAALQAQGQLYEADIPDDHEYLLWDKPLSEQPEQVKRALQGQTIKNRSGQDILAMDPLGSEIISALGKNEAASKYLLSLGVAGVKYLDGSSRKRGEGAYNYVVFDDSRVQMVDKPRLSRIELPQTPLNELFTRKGLAQAFMDRFKNAYPSMNWIQRLIATPYHLANTKGPDGRTEKYPGFKKVFDIVQDYLSDTARIAHNASDEAPTLLPELNTLKDLAKHAPSDEDLKVAAKAIFTGTVNKQVYTPDMLRTNFGATDAQIKLYTEARAAIDRVLEDAGISDLYKFARSEMSMQAAGRLKDAKDVKQAADLVVEALEFQRERLRNSMPTSSAQRRKNAVRMAMLDDMISETLQKADRMLQLQQEGYAPLSRFGRYWVRVKRPVPADMDEGDNARVETLYFGLEEKKHERNRLARKLKQLYPDATIIVGELSKEEFKLYQGMTPDTIDLFARITGMDQDEVYQQFLKNATADQSALRHQIHRNNIEGYSMDLVRVLAQFITSTARASARNLHMEDMERAAQSIPDEQGIVKDEAIKLMHYVQHPTEEAPGIRNYLFFNYLGYSLSSAILNLTQLAVQTIPYLAQYKGGITVAAARVARAMALGWTKSTGDVELDKALQRAEAMGILEPQQIHQLTADAMHGHRGVKILGKTVMNELTKRKIVWSTGAFFSMAESLNRRATFIAAYQTAMAEKRGEAAAFAFAEKAIHETQSIYNKGNRVGMARGALFATLMTFQHFKIQYIEFLLRLPAKQRWQALGILVFLAGLGGGPGADDLDDVITTVMQSLFGKNFRGKHALEELLTSWLGKGWADVAMRGVWGAPGMPIDIGQRLGVGDLLPLTGVLRKGVADPAGSAVEALGVPGSFIKSGLQAANLLADGQYLAAVRKAGPVALQNLITGGQMLADGYYADAGGRRVIDTSPVDAVFKGAGFQPTVLGNLHRNTRDAMELIAIHKEKEAAIAGKWARGLFERDPERVREARAELAEWNAAYPETPIVITPQQVFQRLGNMQKTREQRLIKSAPPELRRQLMRDLE